MSRVIRRFTKQTTGTQALQRSQMSLISNIKRTIASETSQRLNKQDGHL
jgi:hypothetical protein